MDYFGLFEYIGRRFAPPEQATPESVYRWRGAIAGGQAVSLTLSLVTAVALGWHIVVVDIQDVKNMYDRDLREDIQTAHVERCRLITAPPAQTVAQINERQSYLMSVNQRLRDLQDEYEARTGNRLPLESCDLALIKSG